MFGRIETAELDEHYLDYLEVSRRYNEALRLDRESLKQNTKPHSNCHGFTFWMLGITFRENYVYSEEVLDRFKMIGSQNVNPFDISNELAWRNFGRLVYTINSPLTKRLAGGIVEEPRLDCMHSGLILPTKDHGIVCIERPKTGGFIRPVSLEDAIKPYNFDNPNDVLDNRPGEINNVGNPIPIVSYSIVPKVNY